MIQAGLFWAVALWLIFATLYQVSSFGALAAFLRRKSPHLKGLRPKCTILRPIRHLNAAKAENLKDLCRLGVPVVAGIQDKDDSTLPLALQIKAQYPDVPFTIRNSSGPPGANRKVANLIQMLPAAKGDILIFTDADVRMNLPSLDPILAAFEDERVGMVTCTYKAVAGKSLRERLDVLSNNTIFLPSVTLAERIEGVRFALGACIAVRSVVLEKIGGLEFSLDVLPDDYALAQAVRRLGFKVALAPVLLDHCVSSPCWRAMARRHLRWAKTIKSVRPFAHSMTLLTQILPPMLTLGMLTGLAPRMLFASCYAVRLCCVACLRSRLGLSLKDLLLLPAVDLCAFFVYLTSQLPLPVWWDERELVLGRWGQIRYVKNAPRESVSNRAGHTLQEALHSPRSVPAPLSVRQH